MPAMWLLLALAFERVPSARNLIDSFLEGKWGKSADWLTDVTTSHFYIFDSSSLSYFT